MAANHAVCVLNRAFAADPDAIHAMLCNRVPCNSKLADDPTVLVDTSMVSDGFTLGVIGLINGILAEMGSPKVAHSWSDPGEDGRRKFLGFVEYQSPQPPPQENEV